MVALRFFCLVVLLLVGECLRAQQILFRNYSVEQGLCSNTVWCINQDQQGYLWFGTKNGLSRFDGYNFKTYQCNVRVTGLLGENFIHYNCAVDSITFWIVTEKAVCELDLLADVFNRF